MGNSTDEGPIKALYRPGVAFQAWACSSKWHSASALIVKVTSRVSFGLSAILRKSLSSLGGRGRAGATDIELYSLLAGGFARVCYRHGDLYFAVGSKFYRRKPGVAVVEGGVAEAEPESEERCYVARVVPAVAYENIVGILLHGVVSCADIGAFEVVDGAAGRRSFDARIRDVAEVVCRVVVETPGNGEGQFSAGVHFARDYTCHRGSNHSAEIPALQHGGDLVEPRHGVGITRNVGYYDVAIGGGKLLNEPVLAERQIILVAVSRFAVLKCVFVQSAYINDYVGIGGHL